MKAIIVGATGFIGSALLRRAVADAAFTEIVTLSRRELPERDRDAKITNVIVEDFESYAPEVLEKMRGAEVCLWAMGGRVFQFPDLETARKANVDYLHAFAKAVVEHVAPDVSSKESGKKFRFVYCSGMFTEYDQDKKLYFLNDSRKLKGAAESGLLELEKSNADVFEVVIARPAGVLETDKGLKNIVYGSMGIGKGDLAAAMVDMALNGSKDQIIESTELRKKGQALQKAAS